jgi:hypothetical protein
MRFRGLQSPGSTVWPAQLAFLLSYSFYCIDATVGFRLEPEE